MTIDIRIHIDMTPRQKRWIRAAVLTGTVIASLGIGVAVAAGPINTNWITDGGVVSAGSLQGNLNDLQAQINAMTADGGYSPGATYCGYTATTAGAFSGPGALTGYASARAQCQGVATCSSTAAHMCTADELARTEQLGAAIAVGSSPDGWYSTATWAYNQAAALAVMDCQGWTYAGTTALGPAWFMASESPGTGRCDAWKPILCCN